MQTHLHLARFLLALALIGPSHAADPAPPAKAPANAAAPATAAQPAKHTITTLSGKTYRDAVVTRNEGDALILTHAGGVARVPFADLAEPDRTAHGYDPARATATAQARAIEAKRQSIERFSRSQEEQQSQAHAALYAEAHTFEAKILQVLEGGLLLTNLDRIRENGTAHRYDREIHYLDPPSGMENPFVDGDRIRFRAIPAGTETYQSITGRRTVARWAWILKP